MLEPPAKPAPSLEARDPEAPRASFARCLAFRFACVYLVLYSFPFPIGLIPGTGWLAKLYERPWDAFIPWLGTQLLHRDVAVTVTGSGDTTYDYLRVLCTLVLAIVFTTLWTLLARPRQHETLGHWLRVYVRYVLAASMLGYGMSKVFKSQFPLPGPTRLLEPFGEASPMGLLWTFMGFSTPYTIFVGAAESLGGLLLLFRRTTTLGSLVVLAVMTNVVMLNFCYDVPVKLYSIHLWLMALFLLLPDAKRLLNVLILNRPTLPAPPGPRTSPLATRARTVGKVLLAGYIVFTSTKSGYESWTKYGDGAPHDPLDGAYDVEELIMNVTPAPASHWARVGISSRGRFVVRKADNSAERYRLEHDPKRKTLTVWPDTSTVKTQLAYQWKDDSHLVLHGVLLTDTLEVRLRKVAREDFALLGRGFHWVSETPYNR